jgi:hypothetical protein
MDDYLQWGFVLVVPHWGPMGVAIEFPYHEQPSKAD